MSTPPAPARLHVLFAREAPIGVLFRRGPSKMVRLILWHTDTDTFVPGQWLKKWIYETSASLAPSGKLLAYAAGSDSSRAQESPVGPGWIAVSRPPYLTALGLWSTEAPYIAHTDFPENQRLLLQRAGTLQRRLPIEFSVGELPEDWNWRCGRGWRFAREERMGQTFFEKPLAGRFTLRFRWQTKNFALYDPANNGEIALAVEQAEVDTSGRLILVRDGKLFTTTVGDALTIAETQLADFNDMTFEPIAPPDWAKQWP